MAKADTRQALNSAPCFMEDSMLDGKTPSGIYARAALKFAFRMTALGIVGTGAILLLSHVAPLWVGAIAVGILVPGSVALGLGPLNPERQADAKVRKLLGLRLSPK